MTSRLKSDMGGYDLLDHTIWYSAGSTMPAWGLLFTFPLSWIPYPAVWYAWSVVCILLVGVCMWQFGTQSRIGAVVFSASMIAGMWYGQQDALILAGVTMGWLVIERKAHPALMGVAWMLMLIKPQVTLIPVLLFVFWLWRSKMPSALLSAFVTATAIFLLSVALWPQWIPNYAAMSETYVLPESNATIWPWGLLVLPLVMWPGLSRLARLRVALAINVLASPYIAPYHPMTSLAVSGSVFGALVSWVPVLVGNIHLMWIVPIAVLVGELVGSAIRNVSPARVWSVKTQ